MAQGRKLRASKIDTRDGHVVVIENAMFGLHAADILDVDAGVRENASCGLDVKHATLQSSPGQSIGRLEILDVIEKAEQKHMKRHVIAWPLITELPTGDSTNSQTLLNSRNPINKPALRSTFIRSLGNYSLLITHTRFCVVILTNQPTNQLNQTLVQKHRPDCPHERVRIRTMLNRILYGVP